MELAVCVLVVVCLAVMGGLALRADMSERFSIAWQKRNQETLHRVETRERTLRRWVMALAASTLLLSAVAVASVLGFLAQDAKGYGNADDTILAICFSGMVVCPILAIGAAYHLMGMIIRLRAWRLVLAGSSQTNT